MDLRESSLDLGGDRPTLGIILAAILPGALAGTQIAGLLFFLNPHLPFDLSIILHGVAFYGSMLGLVSFALLAPFFWFEPARIRGWLPVSLTTVLAGAALWAWVHVSYFAFLLPPGINRRLLKAAVWLTLAMLVCFYTVLAHRVRHRPYGTKSFILFFLVAFISVSVVFERREAFRPKVRPEPRPTTFEQQPRPKICVIGIEAATLDVILPLAEQGRLPFFSTLLQEGTHGRLRSLTPVYRSALWNTLTTGKYPYRHGIVGEQIHPAEYIGEGAYFNILPLGLGFDSWGAWGSPRPINARDSRVRPLWEILSLLNIQTGLVGWPLSSPVSQHVHTTLSEAFFEQGRADLVFPEELVERARLFRTRLNNIDPVHTSRFGSDPPNAVLEALAMDLWRQDLTFFLLDQSPEIDAFFVQLPGLRSMSQLYFGGFSATRFGGVKDDVSTRAAQLLDAYYTYLDNFLGRLWDTLPESKLLVIVSTHGVEELQGLQGLHHKLLRRPALEGTLESGTDGVVLLLGEGINPGQTLRSAELVDLMPTILYGLGLPVARDHDGVVLTDAFESSFLARQPLTFVPSYEALPNPADSIR